MIKKEFYIFNSKSLGNYFFPNDLIKGKVNALIVSPLHGRSVALPQKDNCWITIKGGGWNYGGPQIYVSKKDDELIFGLYPLESAERELEVSRRLQIVSDRFPKVLYYKKICSAPLPEKYFFLKDITFSNGKPVIPVLLYTQVKSPFRVADISYLTDEEKKNAVQECCKYWEIEEKVYSNYFIKQLAENVAIMHKNGFINDTLEYSNVTMLSEIVDYEWVTAPGLKLPDGTFGMEIEDERKEKELLYGVEVCLQLKALLREEYNLFDIYRTFIASYARINPELIEKSKQIQKFLSKEDFII